MPSVIFLQSAKAQAITVASGSISTASSLLVISIILRSRTKLSSSYHKIMFSLSCWDILSSVAIALTTLPMSKDVLDFYDFKGAVLGNAGTCTAQGFAITAGQAFAILSNVTLNIYYVCTIRFKMRDQTVKKKLLPIMFGISCLIGLPICLTPLTMGLYNPRPFEPYCYIGSYPWLCNVKGLAWKDDEECLRGDVSFETESIVILIIIVGLMIAFFLLVLSLVLVIMSVFQTEVTLRRIRKEQEKDAMKSAGEDTGNEIEEYFSDNEDSLSPNEGEEGGDTSTSGRNRHTRMIDEFQETRTVLLLALMYIGAFFISWFWTIITMTVPPKDFTVWGTVVDYCKLLFSPSQGAFNALIFIYNKIHMVRKSNRGATFLQAFAIVVRRPSHIPEVILSSIDVVAEDFRQMEEDQRIQDLIEADLERQENEEREILADMSAPAASIPSDVVSQSTPSFAVSNAVSSHDIDKGSCGTAEYDPPRRFYPDYQLSGGPLNMSLEKKTLPTQYEEKQQQKEFSVLQTAAISSKGSASPISNNQSSLVSSSGGKSGNDNSKTSSSPSLSNHHGSQSIGISSGSSSAAFTLNSLLSGFSSRGAHTSSGGGRASLSLSPSKDEFIDDEE